MRYIVALIVAAVLIAGFVLVTVYVGGQQELWEAQRTELSRGQLFSIQMASMVRQYWYVLFPLIVLICLGTAAAAQKMPRQV